MNFNQVLELVRTVSDSELTVFQYEEGNQKITMQVGGGWLQTGMPEMQSDTQPVQVKKAEPVTMVQEVATGNVVVSPLVGRFYAAPAEDAEAYVKVGDAVKKGQTLAIVEAMKLMNEIESEYDGVVTEILVDNGQGVEYGQPLFRIS